MANKQVTLAKKLIRIAHANPDKRQELAPKIHKLLGKAASTSKLSSVQRHDLKVAVALVKDAASPISITKMPGFAPMQLREHIDQLGKVRQELDLLTAQYEAVLKQKATLEKEEKAGMAALKKAAASMREKGKYVVEAEKALIQFTAYLTEKRPGIEQMVAVPEDSKWGEKAGDFFARIAAKLGDEVASAVQEIHEATVEDLSHTTMAVRGLKLVQKTSSLDENTLKTAGILDAVVDFKEWLSGKARGFLNFAGDVGRWVKGFVERTRLVGRKKDDLKKAVASAQKQIDKLLAGAL